MNTSEILYKASDCLNRSNRPQLNDNAYHSTCVFDRIVELKVVNDIAEDSERRWI